MLQSWFRRSQSKTRARGKTIRRNRPRSSYLDLEALEDRTLLSVLPAPLVSGQTELPTSFNNPQSAHPLIGAQIAIDPVNTSKMVAVASYDPTNPSNTDPAGLRIWYSTNAGATWSNPIAVDNFVNPSDFSSPQQLFPQNDGGSLTWDRLNNFYIAYSQHLNDNSAGAISVVKFSFSGVNPVQIDLDPTTPFTIDPYVLYRWLNQDPAFNPVIAVDTNEPLFTDPTTGAQQADSMAANLSNGAGSVVSVTLTNGGAGYATPPTVTFTGGGGSGASGTSTISGTVSQINVTNAGSGYTSAPAVTITGGGGIGATATATFGGVASVNVTNGGSGYPTNGTGVVFTGGGGAGATGTVTVVGGVIQSVTITNPGSGYTSAPTISFTGGGVGGAGTATINSGVLAITVTNPGSGYTSTPIVTISGGGGGGATAAAVLSASVTGVNITSGGSGYTSAPTVTLTGGGGAGATATAIVGSPAPKAIYVAWSTNFTQPSGSNTPLLSRIWVAGSDNGAFGFTTTQYVSDAGHPSAAPQIAFSQASVDGRVPGGQLMFFWNGSSAPLPTIRFDRISVDSTRPDNGNAATPVVAQQTFTNTQVGAIPDAITPSSTPPSYIRQTTGGGGNNLTVSVTAGGSGYTSPPSVTFVGGGGFGATATAVISGSVASVTMSNFGSGYSFAPGVTFTGGGGSGAAGTAIVDQGVSSVTVSNGGSLYTAPPTVSFTGGGGSGTVAISILNGQVQAPITITNQGSGYLTAPNVVFSAPTVPGTTATGTAIMSGDKVIGVTITNAGTNYQSPPSISFVPTNGGSGAAATCTIAGPVASVQINNPGTGYTSAPTVAFTNAAGDTTGSGAAGTANVSGVVTGVTITNGGSGYTSSPTVTFTGGGGAGAAGTANINASVTAVIVTNGGAGYTSPPTVVFAGGGGSGAAAVASITSGAFIINVNITNPNFLTVKDLDVTLNIVHAHMAQVDITLTNPQGQSVTLLRNRLRASDGGSNAPNGLPDVGNLGTVIGGNNNLFTHNIGTVFDDGAPRVINDATTVAPFIGHYRPEGGSLASLITGNVNGNWTITIGDSIDDSTIPNPGQFLNGWSLTFTSRISTTGFGADTDLPTTYTDAANNAATTVQGSATNTYPQTGTGPFGTPGVPPSISVAVDRTLGSYSQYQGTIYVGYTGYRSQAALQANVTDTDVFVMRSTDGGTTWTNTRVNNDSAADHFSEGVRSQFEPTLTVDPVTGTLLVMYYDARYDASVSRVATYLATSIDGGASFTNQTYVNQPKTALNGITGDAITIEPIPSNQGQAGVLGFGQHQGIVAYAGRAIPMFSGNLNAAGAQILTAIVTFAAGPRILSGDMGPIVANFTAGAQTYNNLLTADGTREFNGFAIQFDRPIDVSTFTTDQVTIVYRDTVTPAALPGVTIPTSDYTIIPLDQGGPFGFIPPAAASVLASLFLIKLNGGKERSAVGTYSYAIGNLVGTAKIRDRMRTSVGGIGNFVDQDQDAVTGETSTSTSVQDIFAIPRPTAGPPFQLPYSQDTLPLIIPGPHLTGSRVGSAGFGFSDNVIVNGINNTLDIAFDRDMDPNSLTTANILRIQGPAGPITPYLLGPTVVFTGGGGSGATGIATISGGKVIGVLITNPGTGYVSPPTVSFVGGGGTGATGTASIFNGGVTGVTVTSPGSSYSSTAAQTIPAGGTLNSQMTVPDSLAVNDMGISVSLAHPNLAELTATLIAPDGTLVRLFSAGALSGTALTNTIFDHYATTAIASGAAPYTGYFRPETTVTAADVVAGGVGYAIGDILTIQGGTFTTAATVRVTSVGAGGGVTGVAIVNPGSYSVQPFNPVSVTGGGGILAKLNLRYGLNGLNNKNYQGTWTLRITDALGGSAGTLLNWTLNPLTVSPNPPGGVLNRSFRITFPTQSLSGTYNVVFGQDALGNYLKDTNVNSASVANGGSGYSVGQFLTVVGGTGTAAQFMVASVSGGAITRVELVQPGRYTVRPASPVAVNTGTATLNLNFGNQLDTNLNAGVDLLRGGDPNNGSVLPIAYPSSGANNNVPIPAGLTVNSIINVPDSYLVQGVTVQLTIQHDNDPDLIATLYAPDGTSVRLFTGVGTSGSTPHANFTGTTLDDTATFPIQLATTSPGTGIGAGPFTPQLPLSTFKNHGSLGNWRLEIKSNSSTIDGTLVNWQITLRNSVPGSGLGEPVADQISASYRLFTQDPTNAISQQSWTAVGPAPNGSGSGRIGGLAIDPSDPSGNTVYVAGASGGVWKTTNFLSQNGSPTWVPLTDLGPGFSLDTGSIAVFGRNKDPNQSIVFVATGEGDIGSPGVGFLRSMDGGRTWVVLDSTTNVDASGNILPINSPLRNHTFVGTTAFKVLVDPVAQSNGEVIVYAALSGGAGGIWRSIDTGKHWSRVQAGQATDVALAAGSVNATGNLQILYAAFRGDGVYFTPNAPTALSLLKRDGGQGVPTRRDVDPPHPPPDVEIPVVTASINPSGNNGRMNLATPAFTGNPLQDTLYEGWCYCVVESNAGAFLGLWLTKDFGLNWTKVRLPVKGTAANQIPTNNESIATDYSVTGSAMFPQGNYNVSFAIDPNNPNIVYLGGTSDGNPYGFIRIDCTTVSDPYAMVAYDNSDAAGGIQSATTGPVSVKNSIVAPLGASPNTYGILPGPRPGSAVTNGNPLGYYDMLRDPDNPFLTPSSLQFTDISRFNNTGKDAYWMPFASGLGGTDQHELVTFRDPLTGHTRLIYGDDQGIFTGTDRGDGNATGNIGKAVSVSGSRNGNLQITQEYYGAAQPSVLAAQIAGALFYGTAQDDGYNLSSANILETGNLSWGGPGGDYTGVATDQTGSGASYVYAWPCCGATPLASDFFLVNIPGSGQVSRTTGLIQPGDFTTGVPTGQWPFTGGSNFSVNPIDPSAIIMSSQAGRIFLTQGPSLGYGIQWFPIAEPTDLDGTYAPATAFGAPVNASAPLNDFLYVGTSGGRIYVSFTGGGDGGGAAVWKNISTGLDGNPVWQIVTNPTRGSHEAYAVTSGGVFWMPDSSVASPRWTQIGSVFGGSLGNLTRTFYNDPSQVNKTLQYVRSIQADWRFAIPDDPTDPTTVTFTAPTGFVTFSYQGASATSALQFDNTTTSAQLLNHLNTIPALNGVISVAGGPGGPFTITALPNTSYNPARLSASGPVTITPGPSHPVLYIGGMGGPFRSLDKGATWTYFPDMTIDGARQQGGYFPSNEITDLDLSLGNINPLDGTPAQPRGRNMLVATTYGRGTFAIRLNDTILLPNGDPLYKYAVSPVPGPHVVSLAPVQSGANIIGIQVTFSGPVDPVTFTTADILSITRPDGTPLTVTSVTDVTGGDPHNIYRINFASQSQCGLYHVSFGPNVSDYSGDRMDQNQNFVNGENPADIYTGRVLFQDFTNNAPVLPAAATASAGTILEDQTVASNAGIDLPTLIASIASPGMTDPDNSQSCYSSPNPPAPRGIAVIGVDTTFGTWQYSQDGGTTWVDFGTPALTSARLLESVSNNKIRFLAQQNYNTGSAVWAPFPTLTFKAWDLSQGLDPITGADGGTADISAPGSTGGSTAFSINTGAASITITPVNDKPYFVGGPNITNADEDINTHPYTFSNWATSVLAYQPAPPPLALDEATQTLTFNIVQQSGSLAFATGGAPAIVYNAGTNTWDLTFNTAPNSNGTATFQATLVDNGGTANNGGIAPDGVDTSDPYTFTITVRAINDPPVRSAPATLPTILVAEDSANATAASLGLSGLTYLPGPATATDEIATQTLTYRISAVPAGGFVTILNGGSTVSAGTVLTITQLRNLTYKTVADKNGTGALSWTVTDSGSNTAPNVNNMTDSMTITVYPVNDPPVRTAPANLPSVNVDEDSANTTAVSLGLAGVTYTPGPAAATDENPPAPTAQTLTYAVTAIPTFVAIYDGSTQITAGALPYSLTLAQLRALTYKTLADQNGTGTLTWTVTDNGQSFDTGSSSMVNDFKTLTQNMTITVNAVNDAPTFNLAGNPPAVDEDAGLQTVAGFTTGMSAGPADESGQTLTFLVTLTGSTGGLTFSQAPAIDATTGTLTYQAAADANGTATFSVVLQDSGSGTPPNVNTSAAQSFTITVNPINDAPSFTLPSSTTASDEDAGLVTVNGFATNISAGPPNESGQALTFILTPSGTTGGLTFSQAPSISATGVLTYQATANANGTASFSVVLQDDGSGTPPNVNTSAAQTFTITVNAVNDAPSFTLSGNPPAVDEDTGLQTVAGFTTGMSPGPADESGQTLTFIVTQTGSTGGLTFSTAPTINASTGTLTYQAAANANGTATFSVVLQDNGSGTPPNVNTSAAQSFTITVNPINDAPSFTLPSSTTASDEDAGLVTVNSFATNISAGPPNESGQALTFILTPSGTTGGLTFSQAPSISAAGVLTYQATANANGTATFSVVLQDNGSGTSPNVNTSAAQTFTITVNAVNDAPSFAKGPDQFIPEGASPNAITVSNWATQISAGPANESSQTVDFQVSNDNNGLFTVQPAISANGTLTYTVAANVSGSATVTVTLHDNGGTNFGGSDTSAAQTFAINITTSTTTDLTTTDNPGRIGETLTLTATVTPENGGSTPTGSVTFLDTTTSTTLASNVSLNGSGAASIQVNSLGLNHHVITATYSGSVLYSVSGDSLDQNILAADTSVLLTSSQPNSIVTQSVTFTATINVTAPGAATNDFPLSGSVTFVDITTGANLGTFGLNGNQAQVSTSALAVGTHTIQATFVSNTPNFNSPSAPGSVVQKVNPGPLAFTIIPTSVKSGAGFTVAVSYRINGVTDTTFNGPISLALSTGPAGGALSGILTVNAVNGVAKFTGLKLNRAGNYRLKASAFNVPDAVSPVIKVTASSIMVAVSANPVILAPIKVSFTAVDVTGNVATNFTGAFTLQILSRPLGATVTGRSGTFVNGKATLPNLQVNKAGTYKFRLTLNGLTIDFTIAVRGRRAS